MKLVPLVKKGPTGQRIRELDAFAGLWYAKYLPGMKGLNDKFKGAGHTVSQLVTLQEGFKQRELLVTDDAEAVNKQATKKTTAKINDLLFDIVTSGTVPTFLKYQ